MVALALPSCGDMRSPSPPKGRRIVMVSHRKTEPNPDPDPDPDALSFEHSGGLAGHAAWEELLPAHHLLARFSFSPVSGYIIYTTTLGLTVVVKIVMGSSGEVSHLGKVLSLPETGSKVVREIYNKYMTRKLQTMEKLLESQSELRGQVVVLVKINNTRHHISAQISTRSGFPGYELVVLIDDPDPPTMQEQFARADVFIAKTLATKKTVCRPEGPVVAHLSASAQRKGSISFIARIYFRPMASVLRMDVEGKQLRQENHHRNLLSIDYIKQVRWHYEDYVETGTYSEFVKIIRLHYEDMSQQELYKATTLETIRRENKKMSKLNRILKVMWSDPHNTKSFVSCRRKDKPAIWLALHKLIADHGYFTSKKATLSVRKESCLAQLVAACNSSASTGGHSVMVLLNGSRRPPIRLLLDSGASMHVVGDAGLLHNLRHLPGAAARFATLPDGSRLPIIGVGTVLMDGFRIPNVYLVEGVTVNLVSVSRLATEHDICCCFYRNRCQLMLLADGRTGVVGEAVLDDDGVYGLRFLRVPEATATTTE